MTSQVGRALRLPVSELARAVEAYVLLQAFSAVLRHAPGKATAGLLRRAASGGDDDADECKVALVATAVARAKRRASGATCLAQALTGWAMIKLRNQRATVKLGVNRNDAHELQAHAWLQCNGRRVIGDPGDRRFTTLPPLS